MHRFGQFPQSRGLLNRARLTLLVGVLAACNSSSTVDPPLVGGDRLEFQTQPTGIAAGVPFGLVIRVVDATGTPVVRNGLDVNLVLDSTDPRDTLLGPVLAQTLNGSATFPGLVLKRATSFRIAATARGLTGAISNTFSVSIGGAAKLAFSVQPSTVIAGEKMVPPPQVLVQDAAGNTVANDTGLVVLQVLTGPGGAVVRNFAVNAVNGVARFDSLRMTVASPSYTLSAVGPTGRGLTAAVSSVFSVTPGTARKLFFTQGPSGSVVNTAINPPMTVSVADSMNNIVTAFTQPVTLEFDVNPTGAVLGGTTTVNAAGGVATFSGISINLSSNGTSGYRLRAVSTTVADTTRSGFFGISP